MYQFISANFLEGTTTEEKVDVDVPHELVHYTIRHKPSLNSKPLTSNKATWIIELLVICMHHLEFIDHSRRGKLNFSSENKMLLARNTFDKGRLRKR